MNQVPSLGRVVIYTDAQGREFAAIISGVYDGDMELLWADLHVLVPPKVSDTAVMSLEGVEYRPDGRACGWRWPERK
ncbi:hypothetical protein Dxin01_00149 [Deinococcus xinjiangensis]|uniref:Uncharacterized protein n=1 Tax=Deinococcus xinjiangensis TaxID=457454 RepID=A0ABP9V562_9DEIO